MPARTSVLIKGHTHIADSKAARNYLLDDQPRPAPQHERNVQGVPARQVQMRQA